MSSNRTSFTPSLYRRAMALAALAAVACATADPTIAGGSVPLSDVLDITKSMPELKTEALKAVDDADAEAEDVQCEGVRLGNHFVLLGGARIGPYACQIGKQILDIEPTSVEFLDKSGEVLNENDPDLGSRAAATREGAFKWKWRDVNE